MAFSKKKRQPQKMEKKNFSFQDLFRELLIFFLIYAYKLIDSKNKDKC